MFQIKKKEKKDLNMKLKSLIFTKYECQRFDYFSLITSVISIQNSVSHEQA